MMWKWFPSDFWVLEWYNVDSFCPIRFEQIYIAYGRVNTDLSRYGAVGGHLLYYWPTELMNRLTDQNVGSLRFEHVWSTYSFFIRHTDIMPQVFWSIAFLFSRLTREFDLILIKPIRSTNFCFDRLTRSVDQNSVFLVDIIFKVFYI